MIVLQFNNKTLKLHEDDSSYRYRALMEKPTLTLKFSMPEFIEIPVGAWCEYQGEIYTLNKPENFKKQGSRRLEYTLTLGDPSELLGEYKVRNNVDRRLKWSMCAKPREFVQIIVENLNQRAGGGWSVGECIDATEKTIEFNHTYCDAALQSVSEVFNTEWEIIGKVFHLRKVEYFKDDPLPLGYGKGNGFKPGVGRSTESGQKPVKRLYVQGGSRNIDRSKYGAPDLLLPKSQTLEYEGRVYKADDDGYFIERYDKISSARKEDSLDCSEIYPSRVGEVTSVVTVDAAKNWYDFVDNTIPANLNFNDYLIEGETATIVFQSGMLAGDDKQFEFKYDHEKRRFEIKPQEIDGVTMPNASYKPQAGDRYAVFGIMLPNEYIRNDADKSGASWDMFREAARYLYENEDPKFTFSGELQSLYTKKNWLRIGGRLKIGSYILFTDEQFAPDGVPIRIVGIKENLSSPYAPIITISNESHGTNITSKLNEISQNEVKIEESHNDAIRFTKRRFRDATETMSMLEDALLDNFTNSINPIAVRTMQILVGDESLQFRFIQSRTSQTSVNLNITYNDETKRLNCPHGFLQHLTLGINTLAPSHKPNEYLVWEMNAYQSPQLTDGAKQYYLYARVHRTNTVLVGSFLLSPTAIGMKQEANYYHLLVGVLNSEYDGERSFATLYGFTEILPGRVTTDKVVSADGNSFFDMLGNAFKLGNKLRFNVDGDNKLVLNGTMVQSESGDEFPVPCYRGVWNARTTYYKGDLVSYNDGKGTSMYICIAPSYCTGRTPGGDGNAYWSLYASHGDNGDFTEYRYAVNGSKTQAPALASSERNPSDWSVGQPTLGTLQYMWCIFAKISGETNSLLSNWSTPVRVTPYDGVDGKPGKDGKSPVLVFCGKYDNTKTYYGNEHRLDAVKYGDTFYIARIDAGTFYGVTPDNDSKWNNFGASFDSVATNLLLADNANIANLIFRNQRLESSATTNGQPNFFIDGLNNIASFANNNIVFDKSSAKLGWINIVERDLIGYDDNGIERLRITPDPLPDINSYSTKKISITVAGGYDNADVTIGQGDMIMGSGLVHQDFDLNGSLISEDATLSCWAEFYVPASSTLQLLNFEASCPNAKTISGKNITPEISATASLQYKDGNSIGNIDLNSPTPHIDIPNAGTVRLNLSVRCNYVEGISWNGSASIGIQGMSINDTANHIVEARDGIMAIYNGNYLRMHSTEGFSVKIGSTRFRINDSGIAKSSDGTKWTLI